jgi:integrase/recombinase XerD
MKPTDFSKYVSAFISKYLPNELGASANTIASYRDMFMLLISFMNSEKKTSLHKLKLENITKATVLEFLDWLHNVRNSSVSTRNQRLAAIHSFYSYVQRESPENMYECQKILAIKYKRNSGNAMSYLSTDGIRLILQQPDIGTVRGRRDLALLSLMYDSGSRVQEVIDLTPICVRFDKPAIVKVTGKGNKTRIVPLLDAQVTCLKSYMKEARLDEPSANMCPLFFNHRKEKLTRAGIPYILKKYAAADKSQNATIIPVKISPHILRHSKAMHLLQAGLNIVYIRDILGHVTVQTTEIYARADSKLKREAVEKAYIKLTPEEEPKWATDHNLLTWLKSF